MLTRKKMNITPRGRAPSGALLMLPVICLMANSTHITVAMHEHEPTLKLWASCPTTLGVQKNDGTQMLQSEKHSNVPTFQLPDMAAARGPHG